MLSLFLSAMDQTIVGTALPRIVADLSGLDMYSWVFTAYMLAYTLAVPIGGKLGDLLGRKVMMLAGISLFLAASLLGGMARNMEMLVLARGLQGLGGGCISASASGLVGDLYPPAERGRYTGLLTSVYALASLVGPLLGGAVADHWSWRGIFLINPPLGLLAMAVLSRLPATPRRPERSLDWRGALVLVAGLVPLMLAVPGRHEGAAQAVPSVHLLPLAVGVGNHVDRHIVHRQADGAGIGGVARGRDGGRQRRGLRRAPGRRARTLRERRLRGDGREYGGEDETHESSDKRLMTKGVSSRRALVNA